MKKTLLMLAFLFSGMALMAQSEEENLNKWIDTYSNLNSAKNWQEMISNFDQCVKEVPNWNFAHYYKGVAEYNTNNYLVATAELTLFINSNPEDGAALQKAYMFRILSYNKQNLSDQAIADCDKLLALDANNKEALLEKANAYMAKKDYANYIEALKDVVALDANNVDAYKNIAAAYAISLDWANAVDYYNKAIAADPTQASLYESRAYANYSLKTAESLQNALNDFNKAEELGIKTEKLYMSRATLYGAMDNYQAAAKDYNTYITLVPDDIYAYYYRGNSYFKLKKYKECISDMDKVIASDKIRKAVKLQSLQRRGACKKELKDMKGAQADMELIKQLKATPGD